MQINMEKYSVIVSLIILIGKYFAALLLLTLLAACAPMKPVTSVPEIEMGNIHDHGTLAQQYETLAEEMEAKTQAQKKVLKQKAFSSHFGKHRKSVKSRASYKFRKFQQAAQDYREKAAYHKTLAAEQTKQNSTADLKQIDENMQIDKAKFDLNNKTF